MSSNIGVNGVTTTNTDIMLYISAAMSHKRSTFNNINIEYRRVIQFPFRQFVVKYRLENFIKILLKFYIFFLQNL